jgi:acetyl-CoA/propionyl-CoA carboxylase biotin carboxyl carrier protein
VVDDPAFAPKDPTQEFSVHTRWIETEFANTIAPYGQSASGEEPGERMVVVVEVDGRRVEVSLPAGFAAVGVTGPPANPTATRKRGAGKAKEAASGDAVTAPMQGTIVKVEVTDGQQVQPGDLIVVLEAMKMEQPLTAHKAGTITGLSAEPGATVPSGTVLCEIKDAS